MLLQKNIIQNAALVLLFYCFSLILTQCVATKKQLAAPNPPTLDTIAVAAKSDSVTTPIRPTAPDSAVPAPEPPQPKIVASLRRTYCYGKCPVFNVDFYENGKVIYEGERDVTMKGRFEAKTDSITIQKILKQALSIGYFKLSNQYPPYEAPMQDFPATITYVKIGNLEKTILNTHNSPLRLRRYEYFLEEVVRSLKWEKSNQ